MRQDFWRSRLKKDAGAADDIEAAGALQQIQIRKKATNKTAIQ